MYGINLKKIEAAKKLFIEFFLGQLVQRGPRHEPVKNNYTGTVSNYRGFGLCGSCVCPV